MILIFDDTFILGIESSCDDTSAAVLKGNKVLANLIATQAVHEKFGGVVPELASRAHQKNIVPVVEMAMKEAGIDYHQLSAIAFTQGPGLSGSLLVGGSFAKSLALSLDVPLISVHHMHAHILAHFIEDEANDIPDFPFLCLTVSGGHTQIVQVDGPREMMILGQTLDDAAGEAFDKISKIIGLPYPGGPVMDKLAREGNPNAFEFPKPKVEGLDFSFSGLKTAVLYFLKKQVSLDPNFVENNLHDLCASVQQSIVNILIAKIELASLKTGINQVALAGGVSANSALRAAISSTGDRLHWKTFVPKISYCTDNAAMIAMAAWFKYKAQDFASIEISSKARLEF
jgi:N6-L-threonylcarbamoyladenine synthase